MAYAVWPTWERVRVPEQLARLLEAQSRYGATLLEQYAALAADRDAADKIRDGNMKAIGPIIGHVMRETKGRADGGEVGRLVREQLGI